MNKKTTAHRKGFGAKDVKEYLFAMLQETDRGVVLLMNQYLDNRLKEVLYDFFVTQKKLTKNKASTMLEYPGPFSQFGTKILLAYLTGLISRQCFDDLNAIRGVRNSAAHPPEDRPEFSLQREGIREKVFAMNSSKDPQFLASILKSIAGAKSIKPTKHDPNNAKLYFINTGLAILWLIQDARIALFQADLVATTGNPNAKPFPFIPGLMS